MKTPFLYFARSAFTLIGSLAALGSFAAEPKLTPAKDLIGFSIGDDYMIANYTQISALLQKWDTESDRLKVVSIGNTEEGRPQYMAIITSPENHAKLETYREMSTKLARARIGEDEARKFSEEGKAVVWIDGGLHATETVNSQSLTEMVYQMSSRTDPETMRFLRDVILLMPIPNPDGVELVANWYMRNADPKARTMNALPRLYQKYVGHDNNRDSIMHNMAETVNQNQVLYIEWNPQIMHNVHQTGPAGQVVYIPPFRDPFNYDFDAYIPIGIEQVATHMHARLVQQGLGGSAMRSAAPYSTWFNGGMRTAGYFRNNIGILTEIIGGPSPATVTLVPDKQLPRADWPLPIAPRAWHYRDSINYMIELERAVLDYASRNRETVLYNIYAMGRRSIERGSNDTWKVTPKRIDALKAAAAASRGGNDAQMAAMAASFGVSPAELTALAAQFGMQMPIDSALYDKVIKDPAFRDPRGYIISAEQDDYPTVVKFIQVLQKGGIEVDEATAAFTVAGKSYPAGSFIVKSAQAFRPAILDSFEPQDHPMDFAYPGGPPVRPYDITGWTAASQMGVQFDRVMEPFDAPSRPIGFDLEKPKAAKISGPASPAGWLVSHRINDAFILTNRLLKANADVYWLKAEQSAEGKALGTGTVWIPATAASKPIVERAARELGIAAYGLAAAPKGEAMKLKPIRIGLVDTYGGSMPSGWTRWILEKFEFNFEVVFPQVLDAGNLKSNFDVVVFPSGTFSEGRGGRGGGFGGFGPSPDTIPEEFRSMLGSVTVAKSIPPLKAFVEAGGTVMAVGSAASIGKSMGLPVEDHLVEMFEGKERKLPGDKFFIPGSVLRASFDNTVPLAYGMPAKGFIFFDDSPVFNRPAGSMVNASKVAWFEGKEPLYSGWAVGQQYLDGGELATEASIGAGKLVLLGLEATFRATPHGTYKLFFNGLYYGSATPTTL